MRLEDRREGCRRVLVAASQRLQNWKPAGAYKTIAPANQNAGRLAPPILQRAPHQSDVVSSSLPPWLISGMDIVFVV